MVVVVVVLLLFLLINSDGGGINRFACYPIPYTEMKYKIH